MSDDNEPLGPTVSPEELATRAGVKTDEFAELLDKIDYASNETKKLWQEIYENAIDDRVHAFLLFADLYRVVSNSKEGHTLHGKLITQYLEMMSRANEQLLKLAQLVEEASDVSNEIDADALYDEIAETAKGR